MGLKQDQYSESINRGFVRRELTRVYQVDASSALAALNDPDVPLLGSSLIISGGGGNEKVWCRKRTPTRPFNESSKTLWHVTCTFTNDTDEFERDSNGDPVSDPVDAVKRVDIGYNQVSVPVTDATLWKIQQNGADLATPGWLNQHLTVGGPIVNSAGVPRLAEKQIIQRTIAVQRNVRNWDPTWDTYTSSVNEDTVTIREEDADGVRATHVFDPYTLRMDVVRKINTWRDGKLYFAVRFEMTEALEGQDWRHREIDRGIKQRVEPYFPKNKKGEEYTPQDFENAIFENVMTKSTDPDGNVNSVAISEPVKFNGEGRPLGFPRVNGSVNDSGHVELIFDKYPAKIFGTLNL